MAVLVKPASESRQRAPVFVCGLVVPLPVGVKPRSDAARGNLSRVLDLVVAEERFEPEPDVFDPRRGYSSQMLQIEILLQQLLNDSVPSDILPWVLQYLESNLNCRALVPGSS